LGGKSDLVAERQARVPEREDTGEEFYFFEEMMSTGECLAVTSKVQAVLRRGVNGGVRTIEKFRIYVA
jgi:hypothetical protein